jgi:hypothetical protein
MMSFGVFISEKYGKTFRRNGEGGEKERKLVPDSRLHPRE